MSRATTRMVATPDRHPSDRNYRLIRAMDDLCFLDDDPAKIGGAWWWIMRSAGGDPQAYASLTPVDATTVYLSRAGVLPGYRGRGLQRDLIRIRCRYAFTKGYTTAITYTSSHNLASANSLIRRGFRLYWPEEPWGMAGALYFTYDLGSTPNA